MNKFRLLEEEKKQILSIYRGLVREQSTDNPKSISDQLEVFVTNGCVKNGKVVPMNSTNPKKQFAIKQESTKTPGKFRYFFIDETVGMTDETGKFQILPNKWKCSALTKPFEDQVKDNSTKSTTPQMEFISGATKAGYLQTLTPAQKATGLYKKYKVPGSEEFFPPNGIEMFYDPSSVKNEKISTKIDVDTKANIPDNIKACKADIERYYTNYTKKRPMSDFNFNSLKNRVQACKNEFYGDWGFLSGGRKMDKILDIMSGGIGGPSKMGNNAQWRLN